MVEVLLSEKHPDIYYIRYSGETASSDDDILMDSFREFAAKRSEFTLLIESTDDCVVVDKDFFSTTEVSKTGPLKSLTKLVTFGHSGIVLSFFKRYCQLLSAIGVETELLKDRIEFKVMYPEVDIENAFTVRLSNIPHA